MESEIEIKLLTNSFQVKLRIAFFLFSFDSKVEKMLKGVLVWSSKNFAF